MSNKYELYYIDEILNNNDVPSYLIIFLIKNCDSLFKNNILNAVKENKNDNKYVIKIKNYINRITKINNIKTIWDIIL